MVIMVTGLCHFADTPFFIHPFLYLVLSVSVGSLFHPEAQGGKFL
jgi:hypothetical protein